MKDGHCEAIGNPITAQTVFRGVCHSSDLNVMQKDLIAHTIYNSIFHRLQQPFEECCLHAHGSCGFVEESTKHEDWYV